MYLGGEQDWMITQSASVALRIKLSRMRIRGSSTVGAGAGGQSVAFGDLHWSSIRDSCPSPRRSRSPRISSATTRAQKLSRVCLSKHSKTAHPSPTRHLRQRSLSHVLLPCHAMPSPISNRKYPCRRPPSTSHPYAPQRLSRLQVAHRPYCI